ncbi:cathepsin h [Plasmopara halstedii]|uniref:Cathepsin h n=1 Tax=Plasmopara halstedii TaxID=4781 RepID=A0A0N7L7E1_PLAHL|nr:cathepsin h [Plasmopara halstedii]CEG46819.1 cathepsin h [Plasmopara halstedii]|eukprot:XP_024583188.1 cathepsin h [Plasmopara halstedii]
MTPPFVLLAGLVSVAATDLHHHSDRYELSLIGQEASCHGFTTKDRCVENHCAWCICAAVPSSCYTPAEADQLPPAIFQCSKEQKIQLWNLTTVPSTSAALITLFEAWKDQHGKSYDSPIQNELRRGIFEINARSVAEHNSNENKSFDMELNEFADITWDEFQSWYLGAPQQCSATESSNVLYGEVPEQKDWRKDGTVSPVKNQGKCGSCWTFSTTGCLESHLKLKHGEFTILSEQNLLDCAQNFDNHGCSGGLPSHAFEFIKYNGGLDTEKTYPYEAKEGKCKFNTYHVGVQVDQIVNITAQNEKELKNAVGSIGPDVNHAVLAVGYGVEDGKNHWIVKNSWGTKWGMKGFFQIARGSNMCGVADCASYPVVV